MKARSIISGIALGLGVLLAAEAESRPPKPKANSPVVQKGKELYVMYCASCHGVHADGKGPIAPDLKKDPPDLTKIAARRAGRFSLKEVQGLIDGRTLVTTHGPSQMPVWGARFEAAEGKAEAKDDIMALTEYLLYLQTD